MNAIALILLAQLPVGPIFDLIQDTAQRGQVATAHAALTADRELLDMHRGYLEFLNDHPQLALVESQYIGALLGPRNRSLIVAFDEVILTDPYARDLFDGYTRDREEHPALDAALRDLIAIEERLSRTDPDLLRGLAYLRAHTEDAQTFLHEPAHLIPTPGALLPLREAFRRDPALHEQLLSRFVAVYSDPNAADRLLPWWSRAFNMDYSLGDAFYPVHAILLRSAPFRRAWQVRDALWAEYPHARSWARYFHGRLRRDDDLRYNYPRLFIMTWNDANLRFTVEDAWQVEFGDPPLWPPDAAPGKLEAIEDERALPRRPVWPARPNRESASPNRPSRTDVTTPSIPDSPTSRRPDVERPDPAFPRDSESPL